MNLSDLIKVIKEADKKKTSAYDAAATVRRIEGDTAWVHIPGGVDETPVKLTISAKPGDTVQVRVSGGTAFMVGNASAPPTDDAKAVAVEQKVGIVEKVVETVKSVAESAARIAGNTRQYFWFTSEGTDTGAHITEKPQEEFLTDPANGGGNLLARSNGIAIRDGLTELATFGADAMQIGQEGQNRVQVTSAGLTGRNASDVPVFQVSMDGATETTKATEKIDRIIWLRAAGTSGDTQSYSYTFPYDNIQNGAEITFKGMYWYTSGLGPLQPYYFALSITKGTPGSDLDDQGFVECSLQYDGTNYLVFTFENTEDYPAVAVKIKEYAYDVQTPAPAFTLGTRVGDAGVFSTVIGSGGKAESANQTAVGKYNSNDSDNAFEIGNGTDDTNRSNAFAVGWDGNMELALDISAASGTTDGDLYAAITALGWESEVII